MIPSMPNIPKEHREGFGLGVLHTAGRIYPDAIAVVTRDDEVKRVLQETWRGSIEPHRWIVRSVPRRIALLEWWADRTPFPATEAMLVREIRRLEHIPFGRRNRRTY